MIASRKDFTSLNSFKIGVVLLKIFNFLNSICQNENECQLLIHQFLKTIHKLSQMVAVHQAVMYVNGHRHCSFIVIANHHFSKRNFRAAIGKSKASGVGKWTKINPRNGRKMNQIIVWKFSGKKSRSVLYSLNFFWCIFCKNFIIGWIFNQRKPESVVFSHYGCRDINGIKNVNGIVNYSIPKGFNGVYGNDGFVHVIRKKGSSQFFRNGVGFRAIYRCGDSEKRFFHLFKKQKMFFSVPIFEV